MDLQDKQDTVDLLEGARGVMRKGDKFGCRTIGLMNRIYDKGYEIRMDEWKSYGYDIKPKDAVVPEIKKEKPKPQEIDSDLDPLEEITHLNKRLERAEKSKQLIHESY